MKVKSTDTDKRQQTIDNRQNLFSIFNLQFSFFFPFLFCFIFLLLPHGCFSQATTDSASIEFQKQVNANKIATGEKDTVMLEEEKSNTDNAPVKHKTNKFGIHIHHAQRFYWNAKKYPVDGDSSLATKKLRRHSPLYATLFSAVLPGLGQAYNKKYWKIPIVYAGFGGLGYAVYYTATNYTGYRNAYRAQVATVPDNSASYKGVSEPGALKSYRDYFKKNLDISAICTAVWYTLNLVDAAVDAHLFEWNMKDDIHLSWQPVMVNDYTQTSVAPGLRIHLSF